jgi:hypothetical protein
VKFSDLCRAGGFFDGGRWGGAGGSAPTAGAAGAALAAACAKKWCWTRDQLVEVTSLFSFALRSCNTLPAPLGEAAAVRLCALGLATLYANRWVPAAHRGTAFDVALTKSTKAFVQELIAAPRRRG